MGALNNSSFMFSFFTKKNLFAMLCSVMFVQAYAGVDFVIDGISYEITDATTKEVQVVAGENPYVGKVVIPETVTYSGQTYSVNGCERRAFEKGSDITEFELNCAGQVGFLNAFPKLTLMKIGKFLESYSIRYMEAPVLKEVLVDDNNPNMCDVDGILFNKKMTTLLIFPGSHRFEEYTLPSTVTDFKFSYCQNLKKVTVNSGRWIKFTSCPALEEVIFGDDSPITGISKGDINGCENLKRLTLNSSITTVGTAAFTECPNLEWIHLKSEVPPTCQKSSYDEEYLEIPRNCILYVPENSRSAYMDADGWRNCLNILADTNGTELPDLNEKAISFEYGPFDYRTIPDFPGTVRLIARGRKKENGDFVSFYNPWAGDEDMIEEYAHVVIPPMVKFRDMEFSVYSMLGSPFEGCNDVFSLYIPATVKQLNYFTFSPWWETVSRDEDWNIVEKTVTIDPENPYWHITERMGFKGIWSKEEENQMIFCMDVPEGETLKIPEVFTNIDFNIPSGEYTELIIPDVVKQINAPVANNNENLKKLTIGSGVESIYTTMCYGCKALTSIDCRAVVPPTIYFGSFYWVDKSKCVLTVPKESVEAYKQAYVWKDFIIEGSESAIEEISAESACGNSAVYNMQGVKVKAEKLPAGLYISNGRKLIVR